MYKRQYQAYPLFEGLDEHYHLIDQKDRIKQQTSDLARFIQNEYQRNINKLNKLEKTLFDSQNSDEYRIKGDLLFANLHCIQKGQKEVTVENYYDGTMMTIELDERYDGKTNANKYYAKYQKAKNARVHLEEQIALTKEEIHYFDTLITLCHFVVQKLCSESIRRSMFQQVGRVRSLQIIVTQVIGIDFHVVPVSYTHLDVYKRQRIARTRLLILTVSILIKYHKYMFG